MTQALDPLLAGLRSQLPAVLDREVEEQAKDAFGHQHFAYALVSLITSPVHVPPFSIGLLGRWGTGKSTIKALATKLIDDDREQKRRTKTVTFNAWRFGNEDIKRAFLRDVYQQLDGDENLLDDQLKLSHAKQVETKRRGRDYWGDVGNRIGMIALFLIGAGIISYGIWLFLAHVFPSVEQQLKQALVSSFFSAAVIAGVMKELQVNRWLNVTKTIPPKKDAEDYERLLIDQARVFKKKNPGCERLVIFVDDLDRLSAEEMVSGLDAIRTFMEMQRLPFGVVFVISCDETKIADALSNKRINKDLPAAATRSQLDARRFLDRIFQFRLEIPPLPRFDMREFARDKLSNELKSISEQIREAVPTSDRTSVIQQVVDRLIHVDVHTPRNALQLLNAFVQTWWLAKRREEAGQNADARSGLAPGTVTAHPEVLAALCVLRVDFPDFYVQLQDEPRLIDAFGQVFRRHKSPEAIEVNETVQRIIRSFGTGGGRTADGADTVPEPWRVSPEQEGLARYLASIDDVTWPLTLQPFLLLSQDRLSRELGDDAQRVFNELVSGNTQGVYSALGQAYESAPLTARNAEFIQNLRGQLAQQDQKPKERAFSVIAELRFPESFRAQPLMIALAQQLLLLPSLRYKVGLHRILALLPVVRAEERRGLASELTREFLGETILFKADGHPLAPEAAHDSLLDLVRALLTLRTQEQLPEQVEQGVLNWLADPDIRTEQDSDTLPFQELDRLFGDHETELLPLMDSQYVRRFLIAQRERELPLPLEPALQRVSAALNRLVVQMNHRIEAWGAAQELLTSGQVEMASIGWNLALDHPDELSSPSCGELIGTLAGALTPDEDGIVQLSATEGDSFLLKLVEQQQAALTTSGLPVELGSLILSHGDGDDVATALRLMDLIVAMDRARGREDPVSDEVITDWTNHLVSDLDPAIAEHFLSQLLDQLPEKHQTAVFNKLQSLFVKTGSPAEAQRFLRLALMIPLTAVRSPAGVAFAKAALPWSAQQATNLLWILDILPVVIQLFEVAPVEARSFLTALNQASIQNAGVLETVHTVMSGQWLAADDDVPAYDPANVFNAAKTYMSGQASRPEAGEVLKSMLSLQQTIADAGSVADLSTAAFQLWPHDRQTAGSVLQQLNIGFNEDRSTTLLNNIDFSDAEERRFVGVVLEHVASHMPQEKLTAATLKLLARPVVASNDDPDAEMSLWVAAMSINAESTVLAVAETAAVTEPMAQRLWGVMVRQSGQFARASIVAMVQIAAEKSWDSILISMAGHPELLTSRIGSDGALTEQLLTVFQNSQSGAQRKQLAEIMKSVAPDRYFKNERVFRKLTDEDRTTLSGAEIPIKMPRRKRLNKSV